MRLKDRIEILEKEVEQLSCDHETCDYTITKYENKYGIMATCWHCHKRITAAGQGPEIAKAYNIIKKIIDNK